MNHASMKEFNGDTFALEDIYGLTVNNANRAVCLKIGKEKRKNAAELQKMFCT